MCKVSVVMPVYNVEPYLCDAIESVLNQTFLDFELIIVDDGSTDKSAIIAKQYALDDKRIRVVQQKNRGLAGARNTGIRHSIGDYIAFLDSDDFWDKNKLFHHVDHLARNPDVGVSYSGSIFIDDDSKPLGITQSPKLYDISHEDVFCRNPVGNGSAPVIRRDALEAIKVPYDQHSFWYFDENLRQSEDIDCWIRLSLFSGYRFEGIPKLLTYYRVNNAGLSANIEKQYLSWLQVFLKVRRLAPAFFEVIKHRANAYQLRYLARRCVRSNDSKNARRLFIKSIKKYPMMCLQEPLRTTVTGGCILLQTLVPADWYERLQDGVMSFVRKIRWASY